jgi:S1-C subfamily serine protease
METNRSDRFWKVLAVVLLFVMAGMVGVIAWMAQSPGQVSTGVTAARSQLASLTPSILGGGDKFWIADLAEKTLPTVVNIKTEIEMPLQAEGEQGQPNGMEEFFKMLPGPLGQGDEMQQYHQMPKNHPPMGGEGSGFIYREDGYIITNAHVVEDGKKFTVRTSDGKDYEAKLVGTDSFKDVAVLKIEAKGLKPLVLGDSDGTRIGEPVIAIGSPLGYQATVTAGIISTNDRSLEDLGRPDDVRKPQHYLQTDAAINRGNSGGPLINSQGEVIGINQAIARIDPISYTEAIQIEGIGFAIPVNEVKKTITDIIDHGKAIYPGISAKIISLSDYRQVHPEVTGIAAKDGVYVDSVTVDGPASKAGLQAGDVILMINGIKLTSARQFITEVQNHKVHERITLRVARQGGEKQEDVSVVLEELDISNQRAGE